MWLAMGMDIGMVMCDEDEDEDGTGATCSHFIVGRLSKMALT